MIESDPIADGCARAPGVHAEPVDSREAGGDDREGEDGRGLRGRRRRPVRLCGARPPRPGRVLRRRPRSPTPSLRPQLPRRPPRRAGARRADRAAARNDRPSPPRRHADGGRRARAGPAPRSSTTSTRSCSHRSMPASARHSSAYSPSSPPRTTPATPPTDLRAGPARPFPSEQTPASGGGRTRRPDLARRV